MNTTIEFLDAVKTKLGIASDYAIAPIFGVTRSAVSKWRQHHTAFDDESAIRAAEILGLEPATVLAAVHSERAKTDKEKAAWKLIYEKLGGVAASIALATFISAAPSSADAASKPHSEHNHSIHYAN